MTCCQKEFSRTMYPLDFPGRAKASTICIFLKRGYVNATHHSFYCERSEQPSSSKGLNRRTNKDKVKRVITVGFGRPTICLCRHRFFVDGYKTSVVDELKHSGYFCLKNFIFFFFFFFFGKRYIRSKVNT
jgi:hypothetical protein